MSNKLYNQLFNLKFTSKSLVRNHKKSLKEEKSNKTKLKKAIEQGNMDGAVSLLVFFASTAADAGCAGVGELSSAAICKRRRYNRAH